ncbi:hypothetical protein [Duganella sp. FT27W]|uniref:hypothetical protein n=1 Tax=Duganella sp. FT27W TaxID=2654636 RepID=UPI00128E8B69|nr:hypothetical protein [Duganella sp. FT27W]MPQ56368.1 hypothetical protein [Duganella sp. FT27W]
MKAATSIAALLSVDITELEQLMLDVIEATGATGCISDEVLACYPSLSYSSVTARFSSLEKKGVIYRSGDTRPGDSGRAQQVMRSVAHLAAIPVTVPRVRKVAGKVKRTGFMKGLIYAAELVSKAPDLATAKRQLKAALLKAAKR